MIANEPYVSLATYRRNGVQVCTPVWIARAGACFYVFSEGEAGKVKRIRANGRARLAPCNYRGSVRGEWVDAHARITTQAAAIDAAYVALRKKYGWQIRITDILSKLSGRYARRVMIELQLADADTHER